MNNQERTFKKSESNGLTEGNNEENNTLIKNINISDKCEPKIDLGYNRIKYRASDNSQNNKNNTIDTNNYKYNNKDDDNNIFQKEEEKIKENSIIKEKEEEKLNINLKERESISINSKETEKEITLKKEREESKDKYNESKIKELSEEDNISLSNSYFNESSKLSTIKRNIEKNNNKTDEKNQFKNNNNSNKNINNNMINDFSYKNEISIKSEGSNNIIVETKFFKKDKNKENIDLVKESKEKILTKEEILYYTHIIFLNNSKFMKNQQKYMMTKTNFLNILKSLNLISSQIILVEIDLIYDSICPKSSMIIYSQFNQLLMKVIQKLYPEKYNISPKLTINYFLNKLINYYNLFFENKIPKDYLYKYQYNSIVKLLQVYPNEKQINIINEIFLTINEIYEKYFLYELNYNHDFIYRSRENLIEFCKDFEIVPQIINSTQAMTYYNLAIHIDQTYNFLSSELKKYKNIKNKGIIFTLIHFNLFLIHISLYYYTKLFGSKTWTYDENNQNITNEGKLILFLEKLEYSKGMINFIPKLSTPRTKNMTLIPSREICYSLDIFELHKKKTKENKFLDEVFYNEQENIEKEKIEKDKEIKNMLFD